MITALSVSNFKSLSDFRIEGLGRFSCLVGLNGAGKTTLLQALDFIGHVANGVADFRHWEKGEMLTNGSASRTCGFSVEFAFDDFFENAASWTGKYNVDRQRFVEETVTYTFQGETRTLVSLKEGKLTEFAYSLAGDKKVRSVSDYTYKGSMLGAFKFQNEYVNKIKEELQSLKSLELLSPHTLRKASQQTDEVDIGGGGLAGYLDRLSPADARELCAKLSNFYPGVEKFGVKRAKFGWRRLLVNEAALKNPVSSAHVNDGLLRIIAVLSQRYSGKSFVLFDEIENGINQEVIGKLVAELESFGGKQVMVTTHSPLVLNYLTDEKAKSAVYFIYKDKSGRTNACRFFDIPGVAERLDLMGPGEIMGNTDLVGLASDLIENKMR